MKSAFSLLTLLTFGAITYSLALVFLIVPNEKTMGAVQRIFYFHVGSAFASYVAIAIVFFCSIAYLATQKRRFDAVLRSAGEVGFLFCTMVLLSGMIWGYSAWNTPFRMEPRLVSFLLLWFIFLAFNLLRLYGDEEKKAVQSAALGIVGTITVPLMVYSIELLPQFAQLHPQVVERGGLKDPMMRHAFGVASLSLILLSVQLVVLRSRIAFLEDRKLL